MTERIEISEGGVPAAVGLLRSQRSVALVLLLCTVSVAGCGDRAGRRTGTVGPDLNFTTPVPQPNPSVAVGAGTVGDAVARVEARLERAGISVATASAGTGEVRASSSDNQLLDCGQVTQTIDRRDATFPGNAPTSVLFDFNQPGDILLREVGSETAIEIRIGQPGNIASIYQRHEVTIRHLTADRSQILWSQTEAFDGRSVVSFEDGTSCTSSGLVREFIGP